MSCDVGFCEHVYWGPGSIDRLSVTSAFSFFVPIYVALEELKHMSNASRVGFRRVGLWLIILLLFVLILGTIGCHSNVASNLRCFMNEWDGYATILTLGTTLGIIAMIRAENFPMCFQIVYLVCVTLIALSSYMAVNVIKWEYGNNRFLVKWIGGMTAAILNAAVIFLYERKKRYRVIIVSAATTGVGFVARTVPPDKPCNPSTAWLHAVWHITSALAIVFLLLTNENATKHWEQIMPCFPSCTEGSKPTSINLNAYWKQLTPYLCIAFGVTLALVIVFFILYVLDVAAQA